MKNKQLDKKPISTRAKHFHDEKAIQYKGIKDPKDLFLEYSVEDNNFHIDTLERIFGFNRNICKTGNTTGYIVIDGPFTIKEAQEAMKIYAVGLGLTMKELDGRKFKVTKDGKRIDL